MPPVLVVLVKMGMVVPVTVMMALVVMPVVVLVVFGLHRLWQRECQRSRYERSGSRKKWQFHNEFRFFRLRRNVYLPFHRVGNCAALKVG